MTVRRLLNSLEVSDSRLLKVVFCKIKEAVGCTSPQDSPARKMQTSHYIHFAVPQVVLRKSLRSLIDLRVSKPENAKPGCKPEVAVRPFRQRTRGDLPRRIRLHFGKAVPIEAVHAVRRPHNQKAVSRLQNVIDDVKGRPSSVVNA